MAENATIRLNKVLRELNISLDRAVDYLASQGHEVDARPTTKISGEVYQVLLDEFQSDKSKKVASKEVGEEKRKEKEAILQQLEQEQEERRQARERRKEPEVVKAKAELAGPKQVGKIDLDAPVAKKQEEAPKPEPEKKKEEQPEKVQKAEKPKEAPAEEKPQKIETEYQKLSGPKIKDKIDLSKFEKPKKKKEESQDEKDRKRCRRQRPDRRKETAFRGSESRAYGRRSTKAGPGNT